MEAFLLTIVVILLIIILVIVQVFKAVFRFSRPVAMPGYANPVTSDSGPTNNGGFILVLTLVLFAILAIILIKKPKAPAEKSVPKIEEPTVPQVNQPPRSRHFSERESSVYTRSVPAEAKKSDRVSSSVANRVVHYNEAPQPEVEASFYTVQIHSFRDIDHAFITYEQLRPDLPELDILKMPGEDTPYKLIVGQEHSREAAKRLKAKYQLKGFVKFVPYE